MKMSKVIKDDFIQVFEFYCSDKERKRLNYNEFILATESLGFFLTPEDKKEKELEYKNSKEQFKGWSLPEFMRLFDDKSYGSPTEGDIISAFKPFDKKNNGKINIKEITNILCDLGEHLSEEESKEVIGLLDLDSEGNMSIKDFAEKFLYK